MRFALDVDPWSLKKPNSVLVDDRFLVLVCWLQWIRTTQYFFMINRKFLTNRSSRFLLRVSYTFNFLVGGFFDRQILFSVAICTDGGLLTFLVIKYFPFIN